MAAGRRIEGQSTTGAYCNFQVLTSYPVELATDFDLAPMLYAIA